MNTPAIEPARSDDLEQIESLLRQCDLPVDGVRDHLSGFLVSRNEGSIAGIVGLEFHGSGCVVRSLAVSPEARGRHLGRLLMAVAIEKAREAGCTDMYGLTNTTEAMMKHLGFRVITRDDVPQDVSASQEFNIPACSTATVIHRSL